jgi:hypothetical protein
MDLHNQLERYRKEHDEILRFLREFDAALKQAGETAIEQRRIGLEQLREIEGKLIEIRQHCSEEEKSVQSPFRLYLNDVELEDLQSEHQFLEQLSQSFCTELKILTSPPPTGVLVRLGRRLLEELRRHIAREEGMLIQIEENSQAEEKVFLRYSQSAE